MINVIINGKEYQSDEGLSIIQLCDELGIRIPRFCYHKNLSVPANCRMCLVELKNGRKPVPACHTKISNGMDIITESPSIDVIRKSMIEFILINHPLDCPICDEAGQCELQDQAVAYGFNDTSYEFEKRARENKSLGPLISTAMDRCINCTRCIRFMDEVAGSSELGIIGRGENSDISNYFTEPINSELSGNIVDVCPVGALNNAQYLFKNRYWQLNHTKTIDITDALGSSIIVDTDQEEIVRIRPFENDEINGSWIGDKIRYICDAVDMQRLETPWVRNKGKLRKASFEEAFKAIKSKMNELNGNNIAAIAGKFADVESMLLLKDLMEEIGSNNIDCRIDNIAFNKNNIGSYLFNTSIKGIEKADCILLIGTNPKKEAAVLNAKIKERTIKANIDIAVIGKDIKLNYDFRHLGDNLSILKDILNDKNEFSKTLSLAKNPMIIIGEGAFIDQNVDHILSILNKICSKFKIITNDWNGYNFIHTSIAKIGGLLIGFTPKDYKVTINELLNKSASGEINLLWLLGLDEIDFDKARNSFIVYQGHHGDIGAQNADVILPSTTWLEKNSTYVNIEGRVMQTNLVKEPKGSIKEDWKIIKAFSDYMNINLPYNNIKEIREKMVKVNPIFNNINTLIPSDTKKNISKNIENEKINDNIIKSTISDYYLTDVITKNSATLVSCSKLFKNEI